MRARILASLSLFSIAAFAAAPTGLQVERRVNPEGVGPASPRLSWRLPEGCAQQSAYELEFNGASEGRRAGADAIDVRPSRVFRSSERVTWRVRTWDAAGVASDWSEPASFTMGLADDGWRAKWIGVNGSDSTAVARTFVLKAKPLRATLHVAAPGFYEAYANGVRIGDRMLDPSPTEYGHRVLYSTYVADGLFRAGTNDLALVLGHGWYDVRSRDEWDYDKAPWRARPCARAQLELAFADGSSETVATDESWTPSASPVLYDDIRDAEVIAGRPVACTGAVSVVAGPQGRLEVQPQPPARVIERLRPVSVTAEGDAWVLDYGSNLVGWIETEVKGLAKGAVVSFRYDERRPGGKRVIDNFHTKPTPSAAVCPVDAVFQCDRLVGSGTGLDAYRGHFNYSGFRYVTVRGLPSAPDPQALEAVFICTDFPTTGSFRCSDARFNRLVELAERSYRSNFTDGVPTDCPHREKNGWTCDAMLGAVFAQYQFDNTAGYEKWCRDLKDSLTPDGRFPTIIPTSGWGYSDVQANGAGAVWGAVMTSLPLTLHRYQADREILEEMYPSMARYVRRQFGNCASEKDGLANYGIGDWCPAVKDASGSPKAPYNLCTTAFAHRSLAEAAEAAEILGKGAEAAEFRASARVLRDSFAKAFRKAPGVYAQGYAANQAIALSCGLVPAEEIAAARAQLVKAVMDGGVSIDFGLVGAATVFRELSKAGRSDLAWQLIMKPGYPSFAHMLEQGATTLWESFQGEDSQNHVMFADFVAWGYECLAGLSPLEPGWRRVRFDPQPIAALDFVEAKVRTPYGEISAGWRRMADGRIEKTIKAPASVTVVEN